MDDATAHADVRGVHVVDVERIVVAGQRHEAVDVVCVDETIERGRLADFEVFEPSGIGRRVRFQAAKPTRIAWRDGGDGSMKLSVKSALRRLEHEAAVWREEPMKRVAVRNQLLRPKRVRQFAEFGKYSIVDRPQWVYGTSKIAIGERVIILKGSWLAVEKPAWEHDGPAITIGDGVAIRIGCTLSAASSIVLEDNVGAGAYVSIIDSTHTWKGGNPNPMDNPIETSPIRIGAGTWLADRVTVAAGSEIGVQCALAANCVVSGKIADYSIVVGNPGRVVGTTRT